MPKVQTEPESLDERDTQQELVDIATAETVGT